MKKNHILWAITCIVLLWLWVPVAFAEPKVTRTEMNLSQDTTLAYVRVAGIDVTYDDR